MGIFSFLFGGGKYPTTSKYEAQLEQEKADYAKFLQIAAGSELKRYNELKAKTSAQDFKERVNHLKNDKFSQTEEYRKEQELVALQKSSDIKSYVKFVSKGKDKEIERALNSEAYKEYLSLKKVVEANGFAAKAKDSEEAKQQARFKQLSKSSDVKTAVKGSASSDYKNFLKVKDSDRLKKMEALKEYVKSEAFLSKKSYLEDKKRFEKSEECKELKELEALAKNADLVWYGKKSAANAFANADKWQMTFEETFGGSKLDASKWMTGYYMGKKFGNIVYSLADERQSFNEKNAVVSGGQLNIQTRVGKSTAQVWNPAALGFVKQEMECSSAIINTGDSFRQKFGRFDFKVRVSGAKAPVMHNIWLSADNDGEINVATFGKKAKTLTMGAAVKGNAKSGEAADLKFESDFYIYSLVWTAQKLTWYVNGVEVYSTTNNVPQCPMYICLSTNVIGEGDVKDADMNLEWVRVYEEKK